MILVLNCGSQSIKWKIFDEKLRPVKAGEVIVSDVNYYRDALETEINKLGGDKIDLIGHRVVHGGGKFIEPLKITEENLAELEKLDYMAPLHNPFNILGIKTCRNIFSGIPQFAVFDTEFFHNLPEKVCTYALPEKIAEKFGFKKYGFHGISHEYAARRAARIVKKPFNKLSIITCHLGGGSSIAAIKNGKAVDTSMGFTPMDGLVMMTRPGNIDAGIVLELVKNFSTARTEEILNKESGVKGICGEAEMLDVLKMVKAGNKKAKLALDVFVYSAQKFIGAYFAILGKCDLLVFTGAIGSGSARIRNMICRDLKVLSKTKILAVEPDEELAIASKILNIK